MREEEEKLILENDLKDFLSDYSIPQMHHAYVNQAWHAAIKAKKRLDDFSWKRIHDRPHAHP